MDHTIVRLEKIVKKALGVHNNIEKIDTGAKKILFSFGYLPGVKFSISVMVFTEIPI